MHKRAPLERRLYKRGSTWWCWAYDHEGKRYAFSTKQTERKAALAAAKELESKRAVPTDPAAEAAEALTLEQTLALLLDEDTRQNAARNTVEFHRNRSRHLLRVMGPTTRVASLGVSDVNAYVDARIAEIGNEKPQRHTIQKEIRVLIHGLNIAKENGLYLGEPKTLRPKAFKKTRSYYDPGEVWLENLEQCQALIDATSDPAFGRVVVDRKLHVAAYIHTGARRQELLAIYPRDVDLAARTVQIDGTKTDGARRTVSLSPTAVEIFRRKLRTGSPNKPVFEPWGKADRDLKANWARAREALIDKRRRAGLYREAEELAASLPTSISCNDLRRSFCSLLAAAGVPAHHCADLMGHKSLAMVMTVYRRVAPASLHAAVSHLPALLLPPVAVGVTGQMRSTAFDELDESEGKALSAGDD